MRDEAYQFHGSRNTMVMLKSGLNLIQQAISIYGEDLRLIVANRQFGAMFSLPEHLCAAGAQFSDTIRYLARNGEYGEVGDVEAFVDARVQQALSFEPHYIERERSNGRWVSIEGGPLRQGGWVAVYTDITETRQQEEMLRSRSDELSGLLLDRSEELARTNRALEATINRLHETQQHLEAAEARIRLAAETTPAHIARLDKEERYTYTNQRLPVPTANGVDDFVGHTAREVLGDEVYRIVAPAMHSAMNGQPKVVEFAAPTTGRQIRVAFTPDTSSSDEITGVFVLSMDISRVEGPHERDKKSKARVAMCGDWTIWLDRFAAENTRGETLQFSTSEIAILRFFLSKPNTVVTREEILASAGIKQRSEGALDVVISRLRRKLGDSAKSPRLIRTIYGVGYALTGEVDWIDKTDERG